MNIIDYQWDNLLRDEIDSPYFKELTNKIADEYQTRVILPSYENIFTAFRTTPFDSIKVVIIGQDPYQTINYSHGIAFSVLPGVVIPKSLMNIFKELRNDLNCYIPNNGYLMKWAKQGVLLLNTVLTVRAGESDSHKGFGWERFTRGVLTKINKELNNVVFILWGNRARQFKKIITNPDHLIIESVHPSPLSAFNGFFGSKPFSKANNYLINKGKVPIDWQIENL